MTARTDGPTVFPGIRYAEPPTGDRRFAPPVPVPGTGPVAGGAYGAVSVQDIDPLPLVLPGTENNYYHPGAVVSEDCLTLNVVTPDIGGSAPVLVWIHGGAFLCGSGSAPWLDGSRLAAEHGVVVVTLNYRLGYLGGLFLGDQDPRRSNLALQDQTLALRWVRENISAFGGDPDLVTVGGQSAGAMSVAALLVAPGARGLFGRAIVESGHLDALIDIDTARAATRSILERLAVETSSDVLAQLRAVSSLRITAVQRELGLSRRAFPLVMDDVTLPTDPWAALAERAEVDLMVGTTAEEDRLFAVTGWAAPERDLDEVLAGYLGDPVPEDAHALYDGMPGGVSAAAHAIATDHGWAEPARRLAAAHAAAGGRAFHYEFAWRSGALGGELGAAHLVDLPFFFGTLEAPGVDELLGPDSRSPEARRLAAGMTEAVARFARTGDPSGALGPWPPFEAGASRTMVLDTASRVESHRNADRLDFWERRRGATPAPLSSLGAA